MFDQLGKEHKACQEREAREHGGRRCTCAVSSGLWLSALASRCFRKVDVGDGPPWASCPRGSQLRSQFDQVVPAVWNLQSCHCQVGRLSAQAQSIGWLQLRKK